MRILPRLTNMHADLVVEKLSRRNATPENALDMVRALGIRPLWEAAGGIRLDPEGEELRQLRSGIEEIAAGAGYPRPGRERETRRFDSECAIFLAESPILANTGGDILRPDCWAGLTCLVLPHVALWRFGPKAPRFRGGIRNTFQRLWIRGRLLDRGEEHPDRWQLVRALTEDAMVALTERPTLAAIPPLARAMAEAWVKWNEKPDRALPMEELFRKVARKLLALREIRLLEYLDDDALQRVVEQAFRDVEKLHISTTRQKGDRHPAHDERLFPRP